MGQDDILSHIFGRVIRVRIRESPIPNADSYLLTASQPSHSTSLFSVHSFAKQIGTAIGSQPGNRTCVKDRRGGNLCKHSGRTCAEDVTCWIKIEELTIRGNEAIVEARQHCPRKQRLRDGKIHDVYTSVLQTETWVKTANGWKLRRVENERDQVIEVDSKRADPDGSPKKRN